LQSFLQFLSIGLGAGATYALFAQGAVLIYRGSGLVNFAQGSIGTLAAYVAFVDLYGERGWGVWPSILVAVLLAGAVSLAFQALVLRILRNAAAIVRVIATIGLLGLLQAVVLKRYGADNQPVEAYLPHDLFHWGEVVVQEERIYLVAITLVVTFGLWSAWRSRPAPRTSRPCRPWAGHRTAWRRSPGRWAACSAASPRCWPRRSPACRR
jgi:sulfate-transporting ATPase